MRTWPHERLLRRPQAEDSPRRGRRGMSKARAARTFCVSLSSVKRLRQQGRPGRTVGPEEEARLCSEAGREGEEATRR